jgi:MtN3 and saliva related transmembrane protein
VEVIRSRQTKDISAGLYLLKVSAFAVWFAYGVLQRQRPLVVSNGVSFVLSTFILAMTLLPKAEKDNVAATLTGKTS